MFFILIKKGKLNNFLKKYLETFNQDDKQNDSAERKQNTSKGE